MNLCVFKTWKFWLVVNDNLDGSNNGLDLTDLKSCQVRVLNVRTEIDTFTNLYFTRNGGTQNKEKNEQT